MADEKQPEKQEKPKKKILVVGAGLAGLLVAQKLIKRKDSVVVLINDKDYFIFLPRLTEYFAGSISDKLVIRKLADIWKGPLIIDKVNLVNPTEKTVVLNSGKTVQYDILVLAAGSKTNFFNTPGSHNSYPFYNKEDADKLKEHIMRMLDADEQPGVHTFTVIGGGPTGVEVAYVLNKLVKARRPGAKVMLVEMRPALLQMLPENLRNAATEVLQKQGVELVLNTSVANISPMSVDVQKKDSNKETIPCYTTIWAAGSAAQQLPITGGQLSAKGEVLVEQTLNTKEHPEVFCLGDCACTNAPKTAQAALQQASLAAENINSLLDGKPLKQFKLEEKGTIIAMEGDTAGLFFGKLLKGFLAQQARDKYYRFTLSQYT